MRHLVNKKIKVSLFIIGLFGIGYSQSVFGMKAGAEIIDGLVVRGVETSVAEEILEASGGLVKEGESFTETFNKFSPEMKEALLDDMASKAMMNKTPEGALNTAEFKADLAEVRENFLDTVDKFATEGLTPELKNALKNFKGFEKIEANFPTIEKMPEVPEEWRTYTSAKNELELAREEYGAASADELAGAEKRMKLAEEKFTEAEGTLKKKAAARTEAAQTELESASKSLSTAQETGSESKIKTAEKQKIDAENKVEGAKSEEQKTTTQTARDKYRLSEMEEGRAETKTKNLRKIKTKLNALSEGETLNVKEELNLTNEQFERLGVSESLSKEDISSIESKINAADKELTAAKEAREAAAQEFLASNPPIGDIYAAGLRAKNFGVSIFQNMVAGFVFMLPNFVIGAIEQAMANKQMLESLQTAQQFGKIWMVIPNELINENQPQASAFIYIGVSEKGDDFSFSTEEFKRGQYFVTKTDYGQWGAMAITSPQFTNVMAHLNSGYTFLGNGEPENEAQPAYPIYKPLVKSFGGGSVKEDLIERLNRLSGQAIGGIQGSVYFEYRLEETGYSGSPTISKIMNKGMNFAYDPKNKTLLGYAMQAGADLFFPTILNNTMGRLQNNTLFAWQAKAGKKVNPIRVRELVGLGDDLAKITGDSTDKGADREPLIARGLYFYQTQDTPLIKNILSQISSSDPNAQIILQDLADYVVPLKKDTLEQVPLLEPDITTGYPQFRLNKDVEYIYSLLNNTAYDKNGNPAKDISPASPPKAPGDYGKQIVAVKRFIDEKTKYGPFSFGGYQLEITKERVDANIPIYKISNFVQISTKDKSGNSVTVAADDYVVPLIGNKIKTLPNSQVNTFVSLVTSQFYDANLSPRETNISFKIVKDSQGKISLATGAAGKDKTILATGKAPLATIFMDGDINPNFSAKLTDKEGQTTTLEQLNIEEFPVPNQWALTSWSAPIGTKAQTIENYLNASGKLGQNLVKEISLAHTKWKKSYLMGMDPTSRVVKNFVGPFKIFSEGLENVYMRATGFEDIEKGIYVYTSGYFPNEYLVTSNDPNATSGFAEEYDEVNPQRYLISLSTGHAYDLQSKGDQVANIFLDVDGLLKKVPNLSANADLKEKIVQSQKLAEAQINRMQYGANLDFGQFEFYLNRQDLFNKQYIYYDVTGINDPLSLAKQGKLLDQVNDFFVAGEEETGSDGKKIVVYGYPLSVNTKQVASLVTGAIYDETGYIGKYPAFSDKKYGSYSGWDDTATLKNLQAFQNVLYNMVQQQSQLLLGKKVPIRDGLKKAIVKASSAQFKTLEEERAEIQKAKAEREEQYQPLGIMKKNLDAAPYIEDDPVLGERLLKKYQGNYYLVAKLQDLPNDQAVAYIDFNYGPKGKDNKVGMTYQKDGSAVARITEWALATLRAKNGISVNASGKQTLTVPTDHPGFDASVMILLDPKALEKQLSSAEAAYNNKYDAVMKEATAGKVSEKAKQDLLDASLKLGRAQVAYEAALNAKAAKITSPNPATTYDFYYNPTISSYFAHVKGPDKEYYLDLRFGYAYNIDGSPRIREYPVFINKDKTQKDEFFYSFNQYKQLVVGYKGKNEKYNYYIEVSKAKRFRDNMNVIRYEVANVTNPTDVLLVYHNDPKFAPYTINTFMVYKPGDLENTLIGTYAQKENAYFSMPVYWQTQGKGYNKDDAQTFKINQPLIIWDSRTTLKSKQIVYKGVLSDLSGSKETYKGSNVTVVLNSDSVSKTYWLTLKDSTGSYDFIFDPSMVDVVNLKQYWNINTLVDAHGKMRLVNSLNIGQAKGVTTKEVKNVPQKESAVLSNTLANVFYDSIHDRYVYQLSSARDGKYAYFNSNLEGDYIDLADGILYSIVDGFPISSVSHAQLLELLAAKNIGVYLTEDKTGKPKKMLTYRTLAVVEEEEMRESPPAPKK